MYSYKKLHFKYRSSGTEVFCKKGFLRNFAKTLGKHLCQSLFLIKPKACNFIRKETPAQMFGFLWIFENSKNTFSYRTPPVAASVNRKLNPQIGNYPKIRALFSGFRERTGVTYPPPFFSYASVVIRKCRIPLMTKFTIMKQLSRLSLGRRNLKPMLVGAFLIFISINQY